MCCPFKKGVKESAAVLCVPAGLLSFVSAFIKLLSPLIRHFSSCCTLKGHKSVSTCVIYLLWCPVLVYNLYVKEIE